MTKARLAMFAVVAIACTSVAGCASKEPPAVRIGQEQVIFTGTVERVEILGREEVTVFPVSFDWRYLLVVAVKSVEQNQSSPVTAGESINFAIHSPARMLGPDPVGREFDFTATWTFAPEKHFSWLEAWPAGRAD